MEFKPIYYPERLERRVINPAGTVGVVTLWSKWRNVAKRVKERFPELMEENSPIALFSNLYGNGLPQMLANLAYNPQISKLVIIGNDTKIVPSYTFLENFLEKGVEIEEIGGVEMARIKGTSFHLDKKLKPKYFSHLSVKRFSLDDYDGFYNFVIGKDEPNLKERRKIILDKPKFTDFPSDITGHQIIAKTPIEAWIELVYRLHRFGRNVPIKKGPAIEERRILLDVGVSVKDPTFEEDEMLKEIGFDPKELRAYQRKMLSSNIPESAEYSYGNRLRSYWGGHDTLETIVGMLRDNPEHTFAFTSLWDPSNDLVERKATPCLTDIHFIKHPEIEKLMLMASFRAQDLISAWIPNMYGLRAIQEFVSAETGIASGQINLRTRYLSIDPNSPSTISSIARVNEKRKAPKSIDDPKGNYVVEAFPKNGIIQVRHHSPEGIFLEEIEGRDMIEVKEKLRKLEAFTSTDHAMWIGMELAKAQRKLEEEENG